MPPAFTADRPHRSLRLVTTAAVVAVIGVVWSAVLIWAAAERREEMARLETAANNLAVTFEGHLQRSIQAIDQTLMFLKYEYEHDGSGFDLERFGREAVVVPGAFHLLTIADARGDMVLTSPKVAVANIADREHFRIHAETDTGRLFIGQAVAGRATGKTGIQITRRINRPDGRFAGIVAASVAPDYLSDFYRRVDVGPRGAVTVAGIDGIVRARQSGTDVSVGQSLVGTELFRRALAEPQGVAHGISAVDGVARTVGWRRLQDFPLVLFVGIDETPTLAELEGRIGAYYALAAVITALLAGFTLYHRRIAGALEARQARLAVAQRIAHVGDWTFDPASQTGTWSDETFRIAGREPGTPLPTFSQMLRTLPLDERAAFLEALETAGQRPRGHTFEFRFQRQDGEMRWARVTTEAVSGKGLRPGTLRGTIMDITEQVQAERAVAGELRVLESIAKDAPTAETLAQLCRHVEGQLNDGRCSILILDRDGRHLGHGAAPSLPEAYNRVIDGVAIGQGIGSCGTAAATGEPVIVENIATHPYWAAFRDLALGHGLQSCWSTPIKSSGGSVLGTFAIYHGQPHAPREDEHRIVQNATYLASISIERMRAAQEIRELNQELEQRVALRTSELRTALDEIESFSYSVSHDLRAPLRAMDGFSRLLVDEYGDRLDDPGRHYLERIGAGARRMARLIDDLLSLAKVTRRPIARERVDLGALARSVFEELRQADRSDRNVELRVSGNQLVDADPGLMRIALENLIGNAWKFTSTRSEARIEFAAIEEDGGRAFQVRDNGVGFDMAYADKLFGAFQRLHGADAFPGTGIGLATVWRVVNRHGGRIRADSTIDVGTTITFTLGVGTAPPSAKKRRRRSDAAPATTDPAPPAATAATPSSPSSPAPDAAPAPDAKASNPR